MQAGQASLLFVAIILEAGLLFSPEVTLLTAFSTTVFAAFVILLGLSSDHTILRSDAYFAVAFTLGLQALTALIAWLLSQYILETSADAQRGQELQFAQARLDALSNQTNDHQRLLDESVDTLLLTISRVMAGDVVAHAEIPESELTPLAASLNLLLERYEAATRSERVRLHMDAAALPIIDIIARMTDASTPTPDSLPLMTNTPLDTVSLALRQLQTNLNHRLGRVQRLTVDVVSSLSHSQEPLGVTLDSVLEAQRMAGALIASVETVMNSTRRQLDDLFTVRSRLRELLPEEITRTENNLPHRNTGELTGLGIGSSGYSGQFDAVPSTSTSLEGEGQAGSQAGIAPLTMPMPAISSSSADDGRDSTNAGGPAITSGDAASAHRGQGYGAGVPVGGATGGGELPFELVEAWNLIIKIDSEMRQSERLLSVLESQLGAHSKQLRAVDTNFAWYRSALEAARSSAEQLQQIAGNPIQVPGADPSVPPAPPSRPLSQTPGLPESEPPYPIADESELGPGDSIHTPGSLRASDLFSFDDIAFDSLGDARPEDQEHPDDD